MSDEGNKRWKVGDLAEETGLTVRALHHYHKLGLLVPSERTEAGHRLYAEGDVRRLYRILALRQVGLSLAEIASLLDGEDPGLTATVRRHLERVERDLEHGERLRRCLVHILDALERSLEPSVDHFIDAMEVMTMIQTTVEDVVIRVPSEDADDEVPERLGHETATKPRIVLLRERGGERILPIWTGFPEADYLAAHLAGQTGPRPLTSELMARLLEAAGTRVERVVIESLRENTYFATVTVTVGSESHDVDARPSDALNLAARMGAPVFVDHKVMDEHGVASLEDMESRIIAKAESELRDASPSHPAESARLPSDPLGGPGEWQSLLQRMRLRSPSEDPESE